MRFYELLLAVLSVWRITHLLQAEDGPWDSVVYLRQRAADGFWGQLLDCFYCLSVWIAAPFALFLGIGARNKVLLWPALSAGAILLERVSEDGYGEPPALLVEDSEEEHVLWQEKSAGAPQESDPTGQRA